MTLFAAPADLVKQTSTTGGTGTLNLDPVSGFQTIVAAIGTGNRQTFRRSNQRFGGVDWEIFRGTVTSGSPDTLTRDTVLRSSNGGALVNFPASLSEVDLVHPADESALEIFRILSADQTGFTTITLISALAFNVEAGDNWKYEWGLRVNCSGTTGCQFQFSAAAGYTYAFQEQIGQLASTPTLTISSKTEGANGPAFVTTAATIMPVWVHAQIAGAVAASTTGLYGTPGSSNTVTIKQGSWMRARRF
ncbi:MAG TPA: hypothetical protein VK132_10880 [Gemmatimonadales bacterium]|nr:hypothetical protein [Gemmatimonadales bacterium]